MSAPTPTGSPPAEEQQPPTALVVEDDADVATLLDSYLRRRGWAVHTAPSGEDALVLAERHRPALAVVDVVLPGIDGIAVTRGLRAAPATASCRIVLTTTLDGDTLHDLGADATLPKPFTRRDVDRVLDALALETTETAQ